MDIQMALMMARNIMDDHGLYAWRIEINNRFSKTLGKCVYRTNTIHLGDVYVDTHDFDHVRDTILHEIAHALTPGTGHGKIWKAMATKLGCEPKSCAEVTDLYRDKVYERKAASVARKVGMSDEDRIRQMDKRIRSVWREENEFCIELRPGYVFGGSNQQMDWSAGIIEARELVKTIEVAL